MQQVNILITLVAFAANGYPMAIDISKGMCLFKNPCVKNAECFVDPKAPLVGKVQCTCPPGYKGDGFAPPGEGCVDVDECSLGGQQSPCDRISETCENTPGGFACHCKPGFDRSSDGKYCRDIDECASRGLNNCDTERSYCRNTLGGYVCVCKDSRDIIDPNTGLCRPVNLCTDDGGSFNPCDQRHGECLQTSTGAIQCLCKAGYRLDDDDKRTCIDIDECALGQDVCPAEISTCSNTEGSYRCLCNESLGWKTSDSDHHKCENLDECTAWPGVCGDVLPCCQDRPPPVKFLCAPSTWSAERALSMVRESPAVSMLTGLFAASPFYPAQSNLQNSILAKRRLEGNAALSLIDSFANLAAASPLLGTFTDVLSSVLPAEQSKLAICPPEFVNTGRTKREMEISYLLKSFMDIATGSPPSSRASSEAQQGSTLIDLKALYEGLMSNTNVIANEVVNAYKQFFLGAGPDLALAMQNLTSAMGTAPTDLMATMQSMETLAAPLATQLQKFIVLQLASKIVERRA